MKNKRNNLIARVFFVGMLFFAFFCVKEINAANYPLEIIQPRSGLDITNRYYKAYPSLEYNVRMAVIGGAYPFTYELTTAPSGMTINPSTGEISWSNPTTAGSPYSVTARITDSESNQQSVSWTITVTTSGFRFIDAINGTSAGEGGTGTIGNPWKSMMDMYEGNDYASKSASSYAGEFVYWRGGTYYLDAYIEDGTRVPFVSNRKPMVWLAYPSETPVIDYKKEPYSISFYANSTNSIYIDGLTITRMASYGIQNSAGGTIYRRMVMEDLGPTSGSDNQSFFRIPAEGQSEYMVIQDNLLHSLDHGAAIKVYCQTKMLIENNTIYDVSDSVGGSLEGIALKNAVVRPTVRGNYIYNVPNHPIGGNQGTYAGTGVASDGFEILFNYVKNINGNAIALNQNSVVGSVNIYRNTLEGPIDFEGVTDSSDGPFDIRDNVIIHNTGDAVDTTNVIDMERVTITSNLTGAESDAIISSGLFAEAYEEYLGLRGWQFANGSTPMDLISSSDTTPPSAPQGLSVQ